MHKTPSALPASAIQWASPPGTRRRSLSALLALALATASPAAVIQTASEVDFVVGTGANRATLVIDFNDGSAVESFAWGFRWDGDASGADMLLAVAAADPNLDLGYAGSGTADFLLNSISYLDGSALRSASGGSFTPGDLATYTAWAYSISGGFAGDDQPFAPGGNPVPVEGGGDAFPDPWISASSGASTLAFGDSGRLLEDGSWDNWSFGNYDADFNFLDPPGAERPVSATIPEPRGLLLLALAALFRFRRRAS